MQTLTFIMLVFAGQSVTYVLRERGSMFRSLPSPLMMVFSCADMAFVTILAVFGVAMKPVPALVIAELFLATLLFALMLDQVKMVLLRTIAID